jgi:TonB family protein
MGTVAEAQLAEPGFAPERSAQKQIVAYAEAGREPVGARLIGSLPTPLYPKELSDLDGDVRVRFNIDTNGRPVMSSFAVVASSHPLFTAAVRDAVQRMRFEPALSGGADPKPVVDKVEIPFRFKRNAK